MLGFLDVISLDRDGWVLVGWLVGEDCGVVGSTVQRLKEKKGRLISAPYIDS